MTHIVVIEDEESSWILLRDHLTRYFSEAGQTFQIIHYTNMESMLDEYKPHCDIVFLDIELPHMNGMEGAHRLRKKDRNVTVVFVTNMAQYAVKGYEVNAFDFIVKPVVYEDLAFKLRRIMERLSLREEASIGFTTSDGIQKVDLARITCIVSRGHQITVHTLDGSYETYGTLKAFEEDLPPDRFVRCNSGCLVSLRHVQKIKKDTVLVKGMELPLSRGRRKEFTDSLTHYLIRMV